MTVTQVKKFSARVALTAWHDLFLSKTRCCQSTRSGG